ncbi:hypothetical protein N0V93_002947 [Gnomoniopsis smithogilvyi]|uniref:Haloacid dehalogenase n=1 Tax=Gnomoniopsis smithogilvyi TaxID=1191159 RepID=A0A9W9CZF3_9PEZI|nr:hypothetical protein N0V93_002947 [Gnomoniopsis smithogilvyi]
MGRHIIFDFDGTITEKDTIGNIAQAALEWRKTPDGGGADLTREWEHVVQSYVQDLAKYDQTQPPEQQRITWQQERDYLRGRRVVEEASLARVRESGIFAGFAADDRLVAAGRRDRETGRTRIRDGFAEYLTMIRDHNHIVHVVSVNWSAAYIRGVLEPWNITSIVANEIQLDGSIATSLECFTPQPSRLEPLKALATSSDKLEATKHLLERVGGQCKGYFGDSTTDLECLDFCGGWVITASDGKSSLVRTLQRLGHDVPCISGPRGADSRISWAHDFTEVAAHITGRTIS